MATKPVRKDSAIGGRFYEIPGAAVRFPSVTHILGAIAKPAPPPPEDDGRPVEDEEIPFAWLLPFIVPALGLLGVVLA